MDDTGVQPSLAHRRRMREERRRATRRRGHIRLAVAVAALVTVLAALCWTVSAVRSLFLTPTSQASVSGGSSTSPSSDLMQPLATAKPLLAGFSSPVLVRLASLPINRKFPGVTMFRGNASRNYYGEGPVPKHPEILWTFPEEGVMSAQSEVSGANRYWAGTGWTGQPIVAERGGKTEVIFGAYDKKIHFLDSRDGSRVRPDFATGDIIKGTVTLDPDGYPLLYSGSRDNYYHLIALDREEPTELWKLSAYAVKNRVWNDDWDGNGVVRNGFLFEGGENAHFFIIKLNRGYDGDGKVTVKPEVVLDFEAFDQGLFDAIGDKEVSIENSPALYKDRVYFSNSGGLVWGLDISGLRRGDYRPKVVLKWWAGDDVDSSIVVDDDGMLYVASELQRFKSRALENGQIMKLNPYRPADPLVWSVKVPPDNNDDKLGGCWATPALNGNMLYEPTHPGALLGIDKRDGKVVWRKSFTWHAWGSASVVDNVLIVPDTNGRIHAYDVRNPWIDPPELWTVSVPTGAAIESTPVVWKGRVYVGSRDGKFYCFGDR